MGKLGQEALPAKLISHADIEMCERCGLADMECICTTEELDDFDNATEE